MLLLPPSLKSPDQNLEPSPSTSKTSSEQESRKWLNARKWQIRLWQRDLCPQIRQQLLGASQTPLGKSARSEGRGLTLPNQFCIQLLPSSKWPFQTPSVACKHHKNPLQAPLCGTHPQEYSQSPCSEAHADHAATRLRTSTWVMVPGGTGAGARGGGGMALSALEIILGGQEKAHEWHWKDKSSALQRNRGGSTRTAHPAMGSPSKQPEVEMC